MKHEGAFPSFKAFKVLLFTALSENGFSVNGDIAVKDVSKEIRGQIVLAGNSYYLALTLQIAMPSAAKQLSMDMAQKGIRKRFNSGKVFNPILSVNVSEVVKADPDLRRAIEQAEWPKLCAEASQLAHLINLAYHDTIVEKLVSQQAWWPEKLSDDQLSMLVIGAKRMNSPELMAFVEQRYLSR